MRKFIAPLVAIALMAQSQFIFCSAQSGGPYYDTMIESFQKITGEEMNVNQTVTLKRAYDRYKSEIADINASSASYMMGLTRTNSHKMWEGIKTNGFGLKADETALVNRIQTDTGVKLTPSQIQDVGTTLRKWKTNINDAIDRFASETAPVSGVSTDQSRDIVIKAFQIAK